MIMTSAMPRIFVAIPVPSHLQLALSRVKTHLHATSGMRWVAPNNMHLTIRFLGEISEEQMERVCTAVAQAVQEGPGSFTLRVEGIGAFPSANQARVVWAGLSGDHQPLIQLYEIVQARLHDVGFAVEKRPFRPHITLARLRNPAPLSSQLQRLANQSFGSWHIDTLQVMESKLKQTGAEYVVRRRYSLEP